MTGELDNPFTNATRAEREAKERAKRRAEQEKIERAREEEAARVAAKREEARLAKEAMLAERTKQKAVEMQAELERQEREKARLEAEQQRREEAERRAAEKAAADATRRAEEEQQRRAEEERRRRESQQRELEEKRRAAEERRLADLREEERRAEERAQAIREVKAIHVLVAQANQMKKRLRLSVPTDPELYNMTSAERLRLTDRIEDDIRRPETPPPEIQALQQQAAVQHREPEREPELDRASRPINRVVLERETSNIAGRSQYRSVEARNLSKQAEEDMAGVEALLASDDPSAGLAKLQEFVARKVAYEGLQGFAQQLDDGFSSFDIKKCVELAGASLSDRPGNLPALISLGLIGFSGSSEMDDFVKDVRAIPTTVDLWLGHVFASRLFFEYALWAKRNFQGEKLGDFAPSFQNKGTTPVRCRKKEGEEKNKKKGKGRRKEEEEDGEKRKEVKKEKGNQKKRGGGREAKAKTKEK